MLLETIGSNPPHPPPESPARKRCCIFLLARHRPYQKGTFMGTLPCLCTATPLSADGLQAAMDALNVDAATMWAMVSVETHGCGFFTSRRPKILFERHKFSKHTGGRYDATAPDVSNPIPGGYGAPGDFQYTRLGKAYDLDPNAALMSASWGLGQ